jgi:hypothetical protein
MPFLKALAEESPGELTVHCHILWEELFPNFRHEETNLRIFPGAIKSKRQIIFGNLKQINQSSTHFVLRLSHGKDTGHYLKQVHAQNFPLEWEEPDPEAMNNVVWLKIMLQKSSHGYNYNITLWETAFIYIHVRDIPQLTQ